MKKWRQSSFLADIYDCYASRFIAIDVSGDVKYYPISILPLRKHAYLNILKILPPKKWKFSDTNSDIFQISAQNIDCGYSLEPSRRGASKEYPQFMFQSKNKNNDVYLCKPQIYIIKVEFQGVKTIKACFRDSVLCIVLLWRWQQKKCYTSTLYVGIALYISKALAIKFRKMFYKVYDTSHLV